MPRTEAPICPDCNIRTVGKTEEAKHWVNSYTEFFCPQCGRYCGGVFHIYD